MSVITKLAHAMGRRDDLPNKKLARELADADRLQDIKELAENLLNENKNIQSDCIKVLYEIGYLKPELIADYVTDFIKLLKHRQNRMVWGAMIALSTIAKLKPEIIFSNLASIKKLSEEGSVITVDNAIKTLAIVASCGSVYSRNIFPLLLDHLKSCRPKEVPLHAEFISVAVNDRNREDFQSILKKRMTILNDAQKKRLNKLIQQAY
jgi:hypothetical protein